MPVLQLLCSEHYNRKCKLHLLIELPVQYYKYGSAAFLFFLYCLPDYLLMLFKYAGKSACNDSLLTLMLPICLRLTEFDFLFFFF